MPDEHGQPGTRDTRWWMNSAVVRLAFGQETLPGGAEAGGPPRASELDPDDPLQREFGDYELRAVLGRGGMGVVYRAFQRSLDREVALKLLSGGIWAAPEFVATLRSEARHAALLQHPNIVAVHEIGDYDGQIYYAMQLVEGRTLAERLQQEVGAFGHRVFVDSAPVLEADAAPPGGGGDFLPLPRRRLLTRPAGAATQRRRWPAPAHRWPGP